MRAQGGGVIVNISSGASKMPPERYRTNPVGPYASTRYALNAITLIGREELAADNIAIGVMYPGVTATNFSGPVRPAAVRLPPSRSAHARGVAVDASL
jgi:short-subunit dehydrogenase